MADKQLGQKRNFKQKTDKQELSTPFKGRLIAATRKRLYYSDLILYQFIFWLLIFVDIILIILAFTLSIEGVVLLSLVIMYISSLILLISANIHRKHYPGFYRRFKIYENGIIPHQVPIRSIRKKEDDIFIPYKDIEKIRKVKMRLFHKRISSPRNRRDFEGMKRRFPYLEIKIADKYIEYIDYIEIILCNGDKITVKSADVGENVFIRLIGKSFYEAFYTKISKAI